MYTTCCAAATTRAAIAGHSEHDFRAHFRSEPTAFVFVVYSWCTTSWKKLKAFRDLLYLYPTESLIGEGREAFPKIFSDLEGDDSKVSPSGGQMTPTPLL